MTDQNVEVAGETIVDAAPSSTEPMQEAGGAALGESSVLAPFYVEMVAPVVASTSDLVAGIKSNAVILGVSLDSPNADASDAGSQVDIEHPHTTLLRRMTETLRRKWNVFDSELEALLKDAESHL